MANKNSAFANILQRVDRKTALALANAAALAVVAWLVLSHAWFSDDAFFSFRTLDNFVNGYGLTWNVAERVQVYTHPLWVLLLSGLYFFTHEIYLTTIFTSLLLTLLLVSIVVDRLAANPTQGYAAVLLLCLSTAFIDYSSSGLENPLSHLLLGIFLFIYFRKESSPKKLFWLAVVASLGAVNRLDTALFYFPPLLLEWWRQPNKWRGAGMLALGLLPLVAWEVFSIIYYGFPFPNTYYAKAHNYVALREVVSAGLSYLTFTLKFDPITWLVIVAAIFTVIWQRAERGIAVAAGILLYILYILSIGGDFMGGRFLSTAYVGAVILLLVYFFPKLSFTKHWPLIPAVFLISLLASSPPYFLYPREFRQTRWPLNGNHTVDERMVFYSTSLLRIEDFYAFNSDPRHSWLNDLAFFARSLARGTAFREQPEHSWVDDGLEFRRRAQVEGRVVTVPGANGFTGFYAGPDVHFIQELALTDAFLARVPPIYNPNWRSGHFLRSVPAGYVEVEQGSQEHITDATLDEYFQKIRLATRGALFSRERWQAIWELNTHSFNDLLPGYEAHFRFPYLVTLAVDAADGLLETSGVPFTGWRGAGLQIEFAEAIHPTELELGLGAGDNFELFYLDAAGEVLASQKLESATEAGIETYQIEVPDGVSSHGFAAIRILPIRIGLELADEEYLFSYLRWSE